MTIAAHHTCMFKAVWQGGKNYFVCTNTLTFHNDCSRFEAAAKKGEREGGRRKII